MPSTRSRHVPAVDRVTAPYGLRERSIEAKEHLSIATEHGRHVRGQCIDSALVYAQLAAAACRQKVILT